MKPTIIIAMTLALAGCGTNVLGPTIPELCPTDVPDETWETINAGMEALRDFGVSKTQAIIQALGVFQGDQEAINCVVALIDQVWGD